MMRSLRNQWLVLLMLGVMLVATSGCGALLYPARLGAKPSRTLDSRVVVLDCLWLIAGIIPGVVALAVDFTTQAAYFSEGEAHASAGDTVSVNVYGASPADCDVTLRLVDVRGRDLASPARVSAVAGQELEGPLSLTVPRRIDTTGSRLVLAVNGLDQVTWTVLSR
jgi:hypothetical protein